MQPHEEKILIEILKDEELDVFGIFKKRKEVIENEEERKLQSKLQKKNLMNYYKTSTKRLIDCYGKDGAIHYLKALFKENDDKCVEDVA